MPASAVTGIRAVFVAMSGFVLVFACGAPTVPPSAAVHHAASKGATQSGKPSGASHGSTLAPDRSLQAVGGAVCGARACVLHSGTGNYHECLASTRGSCHHWGAVCAVADQCQYRQALAGFFTCTDVTCDVATPCQPKHTCLGNFDGSFQRCESFTNGKCVRWGDICDPRS